MKQLESSPPGQMELSRYVSGSFWERFEEVAGLYPDIPVFSSEGQDFSYREIRARAEEMACRLEETFHPVRGKLVGLDAGLDVGTIVSFLAILKLGAVLLPMDPSFPKEFQEEILKQAPPAFLVNGRTCEGHPFAGTGRDSENLGEEGPAGREEAAALLWTSGSTGRPGGVLLGGQRVLLDAWGRIRAYGIEPKDRLVWTAPPVLGSPFALLSFSLLGGATLVPLSLKSVDAESVSDLLRRERIGYFSPPVSYYRQWMADGKGQNSLPELKTVALGGQSVSWKDVRAFQQAFPGETRLFHRLSSTEAGLISQAFFTREDAIPEGGAVPLGFPPEGKKTVILGDEGNPLPDGEVGEVGVIFRCETFGYWKPSRLGRPRFSVLPNGETMFLTGDVGRFRDDGQLEWVGRRDGLVKIRGFRVETAQVETALRELPRVEDAVLVPWTLPGDLEDKVLVAYVKPASGEMPAVDELRAGLQERLPDFMVPARFVMLSELPRTRNGKPDRSRLPEPQPERPGLTVPFVPPEGSVEQSLAGLWEDVLGIRPIGVLDDFFDLGGHSVQAARLFGQLERTFGVRLPLAELYRGRTIREMAGLLARNEETRWSSIVPIRTGTGGDALFFVHAVGGNAIGFGPLADRLPGYDVYGIQAWGLHPRHFPHLSVEEMAAHYIREMRGIRHEGPYRVLGYSFGGVVAYEMARQLEASGEEVAFLGLLDRTALRMERARTSKDGVLHLWNDTTRRVKLALRIPAARLLLALGLPVPFMHRIATGAIKRMGEAYFPKSPYGGAMDLFLVERPAGVIKDPALAWAPLVTGPIRVHAVAGTHQTMLEEPHVDVLAESLLKALWQGKKKHLGG